MSGGRPRIEDDDADEREVVRSWLDSNNVARRVEMAARQRAKLLEARAGSGKGEDRQKGDDARHFRARQTRFEPPVAQSPAQTAGGEISKDAGFQTRIAWARSRREEILVRRRRPDVASDTAEVPDDVGESGGSAQIESAHRPSPLQIGSEDAHDMLPPMLARAAGRDGRSDRAQDPETRRQPRVRLGTGSGIAAGLCACALTLSVLSFWDREPSRGSGLAATIPEVTLRLTGMEWTAATPQPPRSPARPAAADAAVGAIRSVGNGLLPPAPLTRPPSLASNMPDPRRRDVAANAIEFGMTAPQADVTGNARPVRAAAWTVPGLHAAAPRVAPSAADPRPRIDDRPAALVVVQAPAAPASPAVEPRALRAAGLSGLGGAPNPEPAWMIAALPAAVGPDRVPTIAPDPPAQGIARQVRVGGPGASPPDMAAAVRLPATRSAPRRPDAVAGPAIVADRPEIVLRTDPSGLRAPAVLASFRDIRPFAPTRRTADLQAAGPDGPATMPRTSASLYQPPSESSGEPVSAGADATQSLPLRAVVTTSAGSARLDGLGVKIVQVQTSPFPVASTRVHYFHAEDSERAGELAATLGGDAVGLIGLRPSPPRGLLDIQLAD